MRFGLVGIAATALYAVLAHLLMDREWIGLSAVQASLAAQSWPRCFPYFTYKAVTFMSRGPHPREAPRFLLLTATGLSVTYGAPAVLTGMLGLPGMVSIMVT